MTSVIIVLVLVAIAFWFFRRFFKFPAFGAVTMITGGVKCGKSALTVCFGVRAYRKIRFVWHIRCFFAKLFRRQKPEEPLLYSNIPLKNISYVPLTRDHLMRKVRLNAKSVCILDEASLVADSQLIKDKDINTQLLLFFKLYGHSTHGGKIFCNSHCISDLHYALKRTTSTYYYVHHLTKFPFISCFKVREERYSEDGTTVNQYTDDVDKSLLRLFMFNRYYKRYDCFCYSALTDDLPTRNEVKKLRSWEDTKMREIVSFRREYLNAMAVPEVVYDIVSEVDENA